MIMLLAVAWMVVALTEDVAYLRLVNSAARPNQINNPVTVHYWRRNER